MAKAASPVRLEEGLMKAATTAGHTLKRSAAEQVEYWADIGRKVAGSIDPDKLIAVTSGFAKIKVEEVDDVNIDADALFDSLDRDRESGALAEAMKTETVRYGSSESHPGMLEACYPDGQVVVGTFKNGEFVPIEPQ